MTSTHVGEDGVLQHGLLADRLALAQLEVDEIPVDTCVETRREAAGNVGREDGVREHDGVEATTAHELG